MTILTTDGQIVDVIGPFKTTTADLSILKDILTRDISEFKSILRENDILIVDRGFHDAISILEMMKIVAKIPFLRNRKENQLSTEEADQARAVTS